MLSTLLNFLLGTSQLLMEPKPSEMGLKGRPRVQDFKLSDSPDVFSPKDLISLPRPGLGVPNPQKEDLVFIPVSEYSFDTKK